MFAGLWESPAERQERERRERRQRNQSIAAGLAGVLGAAAAGAAVVAADSGTPRTDSLSEAKDRLRASFWFGFTDTAGAEALGEYHTEVARVRAAAAHAADSRSHSRAASGVFAAMAVVLGTATWLVTSSAVAATTMAVVVLLISAGVFVKSGPPVPQPHIAPPPVVLPSTPRSSPARPLLETAAKRRVQLAAMAERLASNDPDAAQLLCSARQHGEQWVAESAAQHEMHRYQEHRDKTPRRGCDTCDAALAALTEAVEEYERLTSDAARLSPGRSVSVEAISRRAGIAALSSLDH